MGFQRDPWSKFNEPPYIRHRWFASAALDEHPLSKWYVALELIYMMTGINIFKDTQLYRELYLSVHSSTMALTSLKFLRNPTGLPQIQTTRMFFAGPHPQAAILVAGT